MTINDPVFCADDISVDNKPWSGSGHHGVKSEYTLPGDSGVQSSGAGAGAGGGAEARPSRRVKRRRARRKTVRRRWP